MTALSTEAREALVQAFEGNGLKVYTTVPAVPKPPCIVVVPDSPWIQPTRLGSNLNYRVRWKVLVVISPRNNEAATLDLEDAVDLVLGLVPSGYVAELVSAPQLADTGAQGTVYTTEISVTAQMQAAPPSP
jgi:hypothetical protein